ncbi:MAG TPA: amidase family protein [Acidiphilium sp.]
MNHAPHPVSRLAEDPDHGIVKRLDLRGNPSGPLAGLDIGVKDLFDIAGEATSFGNPDWARRTGPAPGHSWIVARLLDAGARITAKTTTVELAFGLEGWNNHYGTPVNPKAPDRLPGGSSCGSAVMVASGLAHAAVGSDTGGSVRIPASFCGLYGLRPSHGAISLAGAAALSPSFDTAGWFARDAATMLRIGQAVLPPGMPLSGIFLRADRIWDNADPAVRAALEPVAAKLGPMASVDHAPEGLDALYEAQRAVRDRETWSSLRGFVESGAKLDPLTAARCASLKPATAEAAEAGLTVRRAYTARMAALLAGGAVLVMPTSPCPAPLCTIAQADLAALRLRIIRAGIISTFAGLPELSIPVATVDGAPIGLSLVAGHGRDLALLDLAAALSLA